MAQKFNNDKYDLDNGKLKEFAQHNPTIIGEPRVPNVEDIDRRIGGLPNVLAYAHQWLTQGTDPRQENEKDIPLMMLCAMARQSGFMETYALGQIRIELTIISGVLRARGE